MRRSPLPSPIVRRQELPAGKVQRGVTLALFFAGAALCFAFLISISSATIVVVAAGIATGLFALGAAPKPRWLAPSAWGLVALLHLFWLYLAAVFGARLAWSVRWFEVVGILGVVAAGAWTAQRSWRFARVPLCLPLGLFIVACLSGWQREEAFVRCDDHARLIAQAGVELAVPTSDAEARCVAGEVIGIARYPRKLWESPDGSRYVFTTQTMAPGVSPHRPTPGRLTGGVCEARADGGGEPRCFGAGKAHGIVDAEPIDRLFVASWGFRFAEGQDGVIYELTRSAPLDLVREVRVRSAADGFYEPSSDTLGTLSDEGFEMLPLRASSLEPLAPTPTPLNPGEIRYDPSRREGVICFAAGPMRTVDGRSFLAVGFRGEPYSFRPLATSSDYPSAWLSLSWGCDWDPAARRVYVAIPNLGLLATLDYDSGRVLRRDFVGFGLRSVAYDPARGRVYLTSFLDGDVVAIEAATGREVARWFAGRFAREVRLTRRGDALLVTSNLGVVRIRLDRTQ